MNQPASHESETFSDISATDFKKHFGKTLDDALRGKAVRITRHGRAEDRWVLLREDDLVRLRSGTKSPLNDLRDQFDELVARMQTPRSRKAAAGVGTASMTALGQAAVKGSERSG
ncbi:MAG: type II toxin-antitoxin system Phd/YefM family antitoxin [Gammaproteobacteria bacterium]